MTVHLVVGTIMLMAGFGQMVWAIRSRAPAFHAAQAAINAEMGAMFFAWALIRNEAVRITVMSTLGVGILVTAVLALRLLRNADDKPTDGHHA